MIGESLGIFLIPVINLSSDPETIKTVGLLAKNTSADYVYD